MQSAVKVRQSGDGYVVTVMGKLPGGIAHVRRLGGVAEEDLKATIARLVEGLEKELAGAK